MLILWKKPNDFTACLISESDEKPKSIQQKGSTLYAMWAAGRKVHQCGGAAAGKKVLNYINVTRVRSVEDLRKRARLRNSTDRSKMQTGGCKNINPKVVNVGAKSNASSLYS